MDSVELHLRYFLELTPPAIFPLLHECIGK